jgi:hypothetical protein
MADLYATLRNHWAGHYLYRGEDAESYALKPKMGRLSEGVPAGQPNAEQAMLREFKRRAAPHVDRAPNNDWEWLSIAQHFGLATRLLDWSENPLVAVWFATYAPSR